MLDHCKSIAKRAKLDATKFDLKTFRSTYATGMLRRGFDVRTLRRAKKGVLVPIARFQFGNVDVDFEKGLALKDGARISLAAKEIELLRFLIDRRDKVVSREELLEGVWEYQPGVSSRTIDVHVAWLRQKLEEDPEYPRYIRTVRGVGYRFSS